MIRTIIKSIQNNSYVNLIQIKNQEFIGLIFLMIFDFYKIRIPIAQTLTSMELEKTDLQGQFHTFLQHNEKKPEQSAYFSQFGYMEQSLKKSFKLITKKNKFQIRDEFVDYWKELSIDEQIQFYCKYVYLLNLAVSKHIPAQPNDKEAQIFIKKSIISNWEKKGAKLTKGVFTIASSKKNKIYPLKSYALRRSKNKEYFGWVLQGIDKVDQSNIHCGVSNIKDFDQWYQLIQKHINYVRVEEFQKIITQNKKNGIGYPTVSNISANNTSTANQQLMIKPAVESIEDPPEQLEVSEENQKTITEIVLNNQLVGHQQRIDVANSIAESMVLQKKNPNQKHPNIFNKLIPQFNLYNFTEIPSNATLLHGDSQYRLCQLAPSNNNQNSVRLKLLTILGYPKSHVFKAITQQVQLWNNDVEVFNVKTSITSQNTAIMYEKHKSQGLLYRERDFLFIRHCFSLSQNQLTDNKHENQKTTKTFIIDKSIDSLNYPPFMTVARGQKEIIWCLVEGNKNKQCLLVIEGWFKGGGYMNISQNKEMTIKQFKAILQLDGYLKQKMFTQKGNLIEMLYFKENWQVEFKEDFTKDDEKPEKVQKKKLKELEFNELQTEKEKEYQDFISQSEEHHYGDQKHHNISSDNLSDYRPPPMTQSGSIVISQNYLKAKYLIGPTEKSLKPHYGPHVRGHHIFKGEWEIDAAGGLSYIDQTKMKEQKKVLTYIIKRIGKNILSGKGILNVSLPVDIFCIESNIEKMAIMLGYSPLFLQKAAEIQKQQQQFKYVVASNIGSALLYVTMEKPFNPILGETYQSWIDGCPVYVEQISHHPPIAAFMMKGRGYDVYGSLEAKMDLSLNSGTGVNEGIITVKFKNGNTFHFSGVAGELSGLTYGSRKLNFVGRVYYWSHTGLFLQLTYNPSVKNKRFFGGNQNYVGEEKLSDYFEGVLKRYKKQELEIFITPKKGDTRTNMIIPKSSPPFQCVKELYRIYGRCFQYLMIDEEKYFDVNQTRYYSNVEEQNPLPSHSNYREDIVHRRLCNFVKSQQWKETLEVRQRQDRKLREDFAKKIK